MESDRDRGPLHGFKVIDLTENMAGPLATMVLGDQGAEVIKVESPRGDQVRRLGSGASGLSTYFANLNRSKRSISIDLTNDLGRGVLDRLLEDADVVVQAFRPAAAARLRVDCDSIRSAGRRDLVYCEIIGFGRTGPLAGRAVYDHVVQAVSGHAALQVDSAGDPQLIRQGIIDKATGLITAQAITAALLRRARTGEGESIAVTMLDVALSLLWPDGMMDRAALEPSRVGPPASNSYRLTPTADGHVAMMAVTDAQWDALTAALGLTSDDADGHAERFRRARRLIATMSSAEVEALLTAVEIPCAPVVALDDVPNHPQVEANGSVRLVMHPVIGKLRQVVPVPMMDGVNPENLRHAPALGAHTREVLREHQFSADQIDEMLRLGVVYEASRTTT